MDCRGFPVYVKKSEVVAAVLPIHEHCLAMSNLDLLLPTLDFGVFFCYNYYNKVDTVDHSEYSSMSPPPAETMVSVIKKALAQALVSFYPLAGEIVQNSIGEPEILCNNRGVNFIHAYAETDLQQLDFHHPDISVEGKLVPEKKHGVLAVQVTELKCGGLVIGCTFDHRVADAHSANLFFRSWAEIARAKTTTHPPIFRRSTFNPRHPPQYDSSIDDTYALISSLPSPGKQLGADADDGGSSSSTVVAVDGDELQSRIYYIKGEDIDLLQSKASYNGCKRTKLESFSSLLFKTIAEGECELDKIRKLRLGIVIDGRKRLTNETLSMHNYFGNVVSIPYTDASVSELKAMQLKGVANMVHACIESASNKEHFLGLIDWVELRRPERAMVKIYFKSNDEEESVVVSSGLWIPVSEINFGWGKPYFGSYHFPWGGDTGYVMPMNNANREGDWFVYMHLKGKHLDMVEKKIGHVFRPLSSTYLNITDITH